MRPIFLGKVSLELGQAGSIIQGALKWIVKWKHDLFRSLFFVPNRVLGHRV